MNTYFDPAELKTVIEHEISEVTDYQWCCEARAVIGQMEDKQGNTVQIQIVVTQEDDQLIDVDGGHQFPITVEE
jgi:hypothetical protein